MSRVLGLTMRSPGSGRLSADRGMGVGGAAGIRPAGIRRLCKKKNYNRGLHVFGIN